jgi:hypothetical protein
MSDELESIGALSTATLAAAAIEGSAGHDAKHDAAHGNCANCGAALTGPFCVMCGQSAHIHRSLLHLVEEVLHGVFHFDTKSWRTIPMLVFSPGRLTRRYIDGQRKNYVSPLALFLFMVFLTFFVASLSSNKPEAGKNAAEAAAAMQSNIAESTKDLADAKLAVSKATAALEAARKQGADLIDPQADLDEARTDEKAAEVGLKLLTEQASLLAQAPSEAKKAPSAAPAAAGMPQNAEPAASAPGAAGEPANQAEDRPWSVKLAEKLKGKRWMHSDYPAVEEAIKHSLANPELAIYKLKNTTYKYSFLLVPISLPFLWLMFFWRRGIAMFDHAVFVLYSLCFMSLLFVTATLLGMAGLGGLAVFLFVFAPPIHMFVQLRGTYGLNIFSALWRTMALTVVAVIVLLLFFLLVLMLSMH